MTNIEQLKTEMNNITNSLKELKDNVTLSEDEKKNKANELKTQAEATKQRIQAEIDALADKTDEESKRKKEKAETLLNSFNETMSLYSSILNSQESQGTKKTEEKKEEQKVEDKGFLTKTKDWVWEQWDKAKANPWKYLLGATGILAAWVVIKKAWNWAFWKKKDKEEKQQESESGEKKWFWKTGFWQFLKWTGIVAWWWFVINWIWKHFGWRWKEGATWKDSDKEKYESYEEEMKKPENKEKFKNYEMFWENIDILYWEIFNRELKSGYEDELEMKKIANEQSKWERNYKWIVPFCLDNQFKNVDNILWQNSSFKAALHAWLDWMVNFVKGAWNDFLKMFAESYLELLPSWAPFKSMAWSLSDKIDQWKIKNQNAEKEMQYFFRQSIRVQTYLFEKKDQLVENIIKEESIKSGLSEKEILENDDYRKKYVENNAQYQNFINNPIHSAVTVLQQHNIFNTDIRKDLKKSFEVVDKKRDEILWVNKWEKDILQIIYEKKEKSETITEEESQQLWKACDWIVKDVDDNILDAIEESAWNIYWDLFRSGDANLRDYLDKSWLDKVFREYQQIIRQKKSELETWNLSNDDKIALAESINAMFALKKEALMWMQTIEKDYDENGNIIFRIPWFLYWSVKNLVKAVWKLLHWDFMSWLNYLTSAGLWTWIVITAWWVIFWMKTGKRWVAKLWTQITTFPASVVWAWVKRIKPVRDYVDTINYPFKYMWESWARKLLQHLEDWKVSLKRASSIVERKTCWWRNSWTNEKIRKELFGITNDFKGSPEMIRKQIVNTMIVRTTWWEIYLNSIKNDAELYESIVKKFDESKEIRAALKSNEPVENLRRIVSNANISEALRNNRHFNALMSDLNEAENVIKRFWSNQAQIDEQLADVSEFRKSLWNMDVKEIERTSELLTAFKWEHWSISHAIEQFTTLRKLEWKVIDTWLLDSSWNPIKRNIDDIIKSMDFDGLRKLKGKNLWASDDAIESLAKALERVKKSKVLKLSDNADEILKWVKIFVKLLAKIS